MAITSDERDSRAEGLRLARVDGLIEGLREHPDDAAVLDSFARGEIDGDEARRRLSLRLKREMGRRRTAA